MSTDNIQQVCKGIAASEGLVHGHLYIDAGTGKQLRQTGNPLEETAALRKALTTAAKQITSLATKQDEVAAEILEFQSVLLEDEDLLAPIFKRIEAGVSAHKAWVEHLDQEIKEYHATYDEYLAARADDLHDLKSRVYDALLGTQKKADEEITSGAILLLNDLTPSRFLELDWTRLSGVATIGGSRTSHVSILARARGVPLVVGLKINNCILQAGTPVVLDAERGELILHPGKTTKTQIQQRSKKRLTKQSNAKSALPKPAKKADGEHIHCLINVDNPGILDELDVSHCDGIGLTRTEFLFQHGYLPSEDEQYLVYRKLLEWAQGRPVTIRTLDAGGDKPIPGVTLDKEANPFLGLRGVRLSFLRPEIFHVQLRALARAAQHGNLKVMIPMVTSPLEMDQFRALMKEIISELASAGIAHGSPALGMMVEVPAAAIMAQDFDADFYSIGSNDLVQYVTATARDNPALFELADPHNPAVLSLISHIVNVAKKRKVEVSVCGDMASDSASLSRLLQTGVRSLSIAPAQLGKIKVAIKQL